MKPATKRLIIDEKGGVIMLVMVLLVVGGLVLTPLLGLMTTGLLSGQVYEKKTDELYAADAGVDDALWRIKNVGLAACFGDYSEYDYVDSWTYPLDENVNDKDVLVTIQNVWMPKDIPAPDADTAKQIIEEAKLAIMGYVSDPGTSRYEIKISYDQGCGGPGNATVQTIGVWLPAGFQYVMGSSDLEKATGKPYYCTASVVSYKGNRAVLWTPVSTVALKSFAKSFTFQYSAAPNDVPGAAVSWIKIDAAPYFTWDADVHVYDISSTATDPDTGSQTTVDSYSSRSEARKLGSSIAGDYVAIGNSLLTPSGDVNFRNRLYKASSATIPTGSIPAGATVEAAYLYWVGWIDYHYWYRSGSTWYWNPGTDTGKGGVPELNYNNYANNLPQLIANARVTTVSFGGGGTVQDVTASHWRVVEATDDPGQHVWDGTWSYTCFYDATSIVRPLIASNVSTFTFGHASQGPTSVINVLRSGYPGLPCGTTAANYYSFRLYGTSDYTGDYTGYPLGFPAMGLPACSSTSYSYRYQYAYCGWSLIIIYSIPQSQIKNQLYLYDIVNPNFEFKEAWGPAGINEPDFDADGSPGGTISGFLVPERVNVEANVAKMTCFVAEGDVGITGDYFKVTGPSGTSAKLWDGITCSSNSAASPNNVWNSQSVGLAVPGVDIDTFCLTWASNILRTGDSRAQIDPYTTNDGFTLVYIILSFRSTVTTGGLIGYLIR